MLRACCTCWGFFDGWAGGSCQLGRSVLASTCQLGRSVLASTCQLGRRVLAGTCQLGRSVVLCNTREQYRIFIDPLVAPRILKIGEVLGPFSQLHEVFVSCRSDRQRASMGRVLIIRVCQMTFCLCKTLSDSIFCLFL